jgi:hypothetical protein
MCWERALEVWTVAVGAKAAAPDTRAKVRASFILDIGGEVLKNSVDK